MQAQFEIQSHIPIPPVEGRTGRKRKYPFPTMRKGDSFFVPTDNPNKTASTLHGSACSCGVSVAVRREGNGVRVWRVK